MPKMKTNRGTAKRFKVTGTGRIKRRKAYLRHQLSCKSRKQKNQLGKSLMVDATNEKALHRLLPYG